MTTVATVSYLNARPLVDGIEDEPGVELVRRVPSGLLETLSNGDADLALCPVIDFQRSTQYLEIVPVGAIGCDGPALTVKLFSRLPPSELAAIAVDGESHTSVALLAVIMDRLYGRKPELKPLEEAPGAAMSDAVLLIGDKVVTDTPDASVYRHRLDLGQAWRELTGRPFVFATWMTRAGADLGDLPQRLDRLRKANRERLAEIALRHSGNGGWPPDLAVDYLSRNLRYGLGAEELAGMEEFWRHCRELGIIDELRPLRLYRKTS